MVICHKGMAGVGKSWLACALVHHACRDVRKAVLTYADHCTA